MRFVVRHHSWYRYDVPVRLGPHVLRLTPRPGQGVLRAHDVRVTPDPVARRTVDDSHGNRLLELEFAGSAEELRVESEFVLETQPFPETVGELPPLPWSSASQHDAAAPAQAPVDPSVQRFAEGLAADVGHDALAFFDHLAQTLYARIDRHIRHAGDAHSAAETLATGRGACRDLTVLFMDAARALGAAPRFVSGYQARAERADSQRYLHAWPEVQLPGMGFRGWDPTHGTRVGEGHVALCAAPTQAATMPIEGGFYFDGPSMRSTLDFSLQIETDAAAE